MRTWTNPEAPANAAQPLLTLLAQYPLLENLVSHLQPSDVVTLTTVCQSTHAHIRMHEPQAKANLLSKTLCSGRGLVARLNEHCPCKTRDWESSVGCAGDGFDAASRPCAVCGINTCDECRVHVTYRVFTKELGLDGRRWWAGYFMLHHAPFAILPPKGKDEEEWYLPPDMIENKHDQGRFHIPLHIPALADPEPLDRILDINLGRRDITPAGRVERPYDGDQLVALFNMAASTRRELVCLPCFAVHQQTHGKLPACECSLRKRFLQRWTCVPCHMKENEVDLQLLGRYVRDEETGHVLGKQCRCEGVVECGDEYRVVCNWCKGEIDPKLAEDEDENEEETEWKDTEDDEAIAATPPDDADPDELVLAENKDGTVSAFLGNDRFSGERLGYGLLVAHEMQMHRDMPCTCCTCPGSLCAHGHSEEESMEEEEEDESEEDFDVMSDLEERPEEETGMLSSDDEEKEGMEIGE